MTLPEVCPLDENQKCKGRECHLFCLEWRTREPTCLIGYSTTSRVKSWKSDRRQDTYAEDTFRKLSEQPASKRKNVSEKGDWIPSRLAGNPQGKTLQRKEEEFIPDPISQKQIVRPSAPRPEKDHEGRLKEKPIIYGKPQLKVPEKPKVPEKVVSSNKHTTIFTSSEIDEKKDSYPSGRNEKTRNTPENKEKRRKLEEVMKIDTPEVYDEEFWS